MSELAAKEWPSSKYLSGRLLTWGRFQDLDCWSRMSLWASQTPSLTRASDMEGVDEIFMNGWNICHCCDKHPRNRMEQRRFILAHGFSPWSADSVVSLRWVNIITRSIWPNNTHTPWQTGSRGRGEDPSFHDLCPLWLASPKLATPPTFYQLSVIPS